jgi:hypothetical protein
MKTLKVEFYAEDFKTFTEPTDLEWFDELLDSDERFEY